MSDLLPKEITMYDVPARLSNDEAIGYLQGYNDAIHKLRNTTSTGWQDIKDAPFNQEVIILTYGGCVLKAKLVPDAGLNEDEKTVNQWMATTECFPPCWSAGECWSSNENEEQSDWPIGWLPTPPRQDEGKR